MRPRYEQVSNEAEALLKKASNLADRMTAIEKAKTCPCGSEKPQADCCDMKKAKTCPCGSEKPQADCCDMKKASPDYVESFNTKPQEVTFVSETGGQTKSAGYSTNGHLLDVEDVANKGASSSTVNFDSLANRMNSHQNGNQDQIVQDDNKQPIRD